MSTSYSREVWIYQKKYDKIIDASGGAIPEKHVGIGVGINVGFEVIRGEKSSLEDKPTLVGIRAFLRIEVSEEGGYAGKPKNKHISVNDPDATHVLVRVAVPPRTNCKKII